MIPRVACGRAPAATEAIAAMPFESSLPLVVACLAVAVVATVIWTRAPSPGWLVAAALATVLGVGALVADRIVVTDREAVLELLPRLARAFEQQDVQTILAAIDPDLRPVRDAAERALREVRPTEVVITKLDVSVDSATQPPQAVADIIVRVTGDASNLPGTVLAAVRVSLRKRDGKWLVTDADAEPVRPGSARTSRHESVPRGRPIAASEPRLSAAA